MDCAAPSLGSPPIQRHLWMLGRLVSERAAEVSDLTVVCCTSQGLVRGGRDDANKDICVHEHVRRVYKTRSLRVSVRLWCGHPLSPELLSGWRLAASPQRRSSRTCWPGKGCAVDDGRMSPDIQLLIQTAFVLFVYLFV
jgi:hypothetical protein